MPADNVEMNLQMDILANWIKTQEHMPQHIERILLMRYIFASQNIVEDAKKLIDFSYTMRNKYSKVFMIRDPSDSETQKALEITQIIPLPKRTAENYRVLLTRLGDTDINKFNFNECIKVFFMFEDVRSVIPDDDKGGISDGDVTVFDMQTFSLRHITKVVLSSLRVYMKYTQEAHCLKIKHLHIINCSPLINKIMFLVKPFIRKDVYEMIHFHYPNSDTLDEFVPKDILPNEYGGNSGALEDIKKDWIRIIQEKREYLMNEKYWKVDESKRKSSNKLDKTKSDSNMNSVEFD